MIEIGGINYTIIRRSEASGTPNPKEIMVYTDEFCPSIIGLKCPEAIDENKCTLKCGTCWKTVLDRIDDFKILWKYKGSDEYV